MPAEPTVKRAIAFFDGQNLFHAARKAFGYTFPNYDPVALAETICAKQGWELSAVRFYTGIPEPVDDSRWNRFWNNKLAVLGTRGVFTYARALRYQKKTFNLPDGSQHNFLVGHEKGIDIRIALDIIRLALDSHCDVALVFSQDQDFSEIAEEMRGIVRRQQRWIKMASAYPSSSDYPNRRGIEKTDWIRIEKSTYDQCLDSNDYRVSYPFPSTASTSGRSMSSAPPLTNFDGSNS
ncbi:MAG TPA: NYN domain-containing protein [Thermoanaerobaculia bacterium]